MSNPTKTREEFETLEGVSNEALDEADRRLVEKMITEAKHDLIVLDAEISDALSMLSALEKRREKTITRAKRLRIWTAPHKYIPPEILAKIFVHCLGGNPAPVPPSTSVSMPWVLGHVCSRWREVSLSEHRLWDHITFHPWGNYPRLALEEVFRRSGESRNIKLGPVHHRFSQAILPILLYYHNRLKSLTIEITESTVTFLREISAFEQLESLSIYYIDFLHPIPRISALPALRELRLTGNNLIPLHNTWFNPTCSIWARLTLLEIGRYIDTPPSTMLNILQQCKALLRCSVFLSQEPESVSLHAGTLSIIIPTLQSLRVHISNLNPGTFLASLSLPSLKVFELGSRDRRETQAWSQQELLGLLERSRCHLEEFILYNYPMPSDCVIPIMRALPDIVQFKIETRDPIPSGMIEVMISDNLLPNLALLDLTFASSHAALKLLQSRWVGAIGKGIRSGNLCISHGDGEDEDGLEALKRLVMRMNTPINIISL